MPLAPPSWSLLGQREKSRVLYFYNKLLQQRQSFVHRQRKRIAQRARRHPGLVSRDGDWWGWDRTGVPGQGRFTVP